MADWFRRRVAMVSEGICGVCAFRLDEDGVCPPCGFRWSVGPPTERESWMGPIILRQEVVS